jgi:hypothetical protein
MVEENEFVKKHRAITPQMWPTEDPPEDHPYSDVSGKDRKWSNTNPPTRTDKEVKKARKEK